MVNLPGPGDAAAYSIEVQAGYVEVRAATAAFKVLDSAVARGYAPSVPNCLSDARRGGMGYHHINRGYLDTKVEVARPEILLYERLPDGRYVLNGVEYIVPFRVWPADSTPPKVMGLDLIPADDLKLWYLHMWAWTPNPRGLFENYNPAVKCPEG